MIWLERTFQFCQRNPFVASGVGLVAMLWIVLFLVFGAMARHEDTRVNAIEREADKWCQVSTKTGVMFVKPKARPDGALVCPSQP